MGRYRPQLTDPERPDRSATVVRTPSGTDLDVVDPALAEELGHDARVLKLDRGLFDVLPLSLLTTGAIATLEGRTQAALDVRRFRPNLLVDAGAGDPWPEDAWVGAELAIGGLRMRVDQRDARCVMVNVDPETTERDPAVLRTLAQEHDACFGVYGTTVAPGRVAVGDPVVLLPAG